MGSVNLHETTMGKQLITSTLPDIAKQLKRIADANDYSRSEWIGKEVQIYPGDTRSKWGKIVDMNQHGVTFLITNYTGNDGEWQIGKRTFIAYSSKLTFREIN
jgi:hypothetical protein